MNKKLPPWLLLIGFILSFSSGILNSFFLLSYMFPVANLSGTTSNFAIAISTGNTAMILRDFLLIAFFILGAAVSGGIVRDYHLRLGRRYGVVLLLCALNAVVTYLFLLKNIDYGFVFISLACGMQNAMATTYSGAVLRTTHVTGVFTDLGIQLGHALVGRGFDRYKIFIYCVLLLGFFSGSFTGAIGLDILGNKTVLVYACITAGLGLMYFIVRRLTMIAAKRSEKIV